MEKNINVKVVGPMVGDFAIHANVGDKLVVRLNTYPKDPTAIKLETVSGGEVGYVAAQKKTAGEYPLAKEVYSLVSEGDVLEITSTDPLLVGIPNKETGSQTNKVIKKLIALLAGNKLEYPNRIKIVNALRQNKGSQVGLDVEIVGDRVVLSFDGVPCGYATAEVTAPAERVLKMNGMEPSSIEHIISAINTSESVKASSTWIDGMVVPIIFEVEVEAEEAPALAIQEKSLEKILKEFDESDAKEIQKRLDWLKSIGTPEYVFPLFLNKIKNHKGIAPFTPCYVPQGKEIANAIAFSHGLGEHRGNLLLVGPAGSGKNTFLITFANLMDLQLIDKSCSAGVDEEAIFGYLSMKATERPEKEAVNLAFKKMLTSVNFYKIKSKKEFASLDVESQIKIMQEVVADDDFDYSILFDALRSESAEIKFEPSIITKSLEYPSIINFDEVNTLRPTVTASMHAALDKRRAILVNSYKTVKLDDDVIFTATMNEGSDYAGTNSLNLAFEDRFHVIEFEAPDSIAAILKQEVPSISNKAVKVLDDLYKKMKAIKGFEIQDRSFSQRAFIFCAINIAQGNDIKEAIMDVIIPKIRDKEDKEAVKAYVDLKTK